MCSLKFFTVLCWTHFVAFVVYVHVNYKLEKRMAAPVRVFGGNLILNQNIRSAHRPLTETLLFEDYLESVLRGL